MGINNLGNTQCNLYSIILNNPSVNGKGTKEISKMFLI